MIDNHCVLYNVQPASSLLEVTPILAATHFQRLEANLMFYIGRWVYALRHHFNSY